MKKRSEKPKKKRASVESQQLKHQKSLLREQKYRKKVEDDLNLKLANESEERVRTLMKKYAIFLKKNSTRHILIKNFFTEQECNALKEWIVSVTPPQDTESINFPAGQEEFDTEDVQFSEIEEHHRYQSVQLIIGNALPESGMVYEAGKLDKTGVPRKTIKERETLVQLALSTCPQILKNFIATINRMDPTELLCYNMEK